MKPPEPYHEIGELLRAHKPDPQPTPGLESRIVRALGEPERPQNVHRVWPWFLLPPAVAAAIVVMWPEPVARAPLVRTEPAPVAAQEDSAATAILASNPLEQEKLALENDARRASRFLIDCLPSLTSPID